MIQFLIAVLSALVVPGVARAQVTTEQAPFITTPPEVVARMLALAGTGTQDFVVDLGSGDGRIVIAAARNFGARGLGLDIDARLVALSRENARAAGVAERVAFEHRDVLQADLSGATVVTLYLLPSIIDRLQPKLLDELRPGSRIVSHAFAMVGWKPDRMETLRLAKRHDGQGDESRVLLWVVPATVRGSWRARDWRLRISQNYQEIELEGEAYGRPLEVRQAKLDGAAIRFSSPGLEFSGRVEGKRISGELRRDGVATPLELVRD
ncbi:MAG: methyltransferase domain-containing protein [Betaproteobacteria bacterium]